jgi:positive regulator of sigma E activity
MKTGKYAHLSTIGPVLTIVIGVVLLLRQMYFDNEPGALPLLLIVCGLGWYFVTRTRIRSRHK